MTFLSLGTNLEVIKKKILQVYNHVIVGNNFNKLSHCRNDKEHYVNLSFPSLLFSTVLS